MVNASARRSAYAYRLVNMQEPSSYYGPCEVCKNHVSEVFMMAEMTASPGLNKRMEGYSFYLCTAHLFGHRECLIGRQRVGTAMDAVSVVDASQSVGKCG